MSFYLKQALVLDFCLTVHHQLGKVIQMNQLDATMIY